MNAYKQARTREKNQQLSHKTIITRSKPVSRLHLTCQDLSEWRTDQKRSIRISLNPPLPFLSLSPSSSSSSSSSSFPVFNSTPPLLMLSVVDQMFAVVLLARRCPAPSPSNTHLIYLCLSILCVDRRLSNTKHTHTHTHTHTNTHQPNRRRKIMKKQQKKQQNRGTNTKKGSSENPETKE